jgi:hypothetical protein
LLRRSVQGESPRTTVRGAWLQTWLSDTSRFDRAVFSIETRDQLLQIRMPGGFDEQQAFIAVNGLSIAPEMAGPNTLVVRLPELRDGRGLVEVAYRVPHEVRWWNTRLELPQMENAAWVARWVWQLIVSPVHHIYQPSTELTSLDRWTWQGWYWARESTWQQSDLENWLQVHQQPPVPPNAHPYTFTSVRPIAGARLWVLDQRTLLMIGAGLGVILAALWWQFPVMRHWGLCVPLAFVLLCLGIWWPTPAVMVGQASFVGILLVMLSQLVIRIWSGRAVRISVSPSTRSMPRPSTAKRPSSITPAASVTGEGQ